ncbi:CxC2 domain-containing protein [Mycena kentingensis (nom. inval.)]|nr:CxC2 domain-containing protein [Mycena kentingensis (nom. inval.)]
MVGRAKSTARKRQLRRESEDYWMARAVERYRQRKELEARSGLKPGERVKGACKFCEDTEAEFQLRQSTSSFIFTSSPIKPTDEPPRFQPTLISPRKVRKQQYHNLLATPPSTVLEEELQEALSELLDKYEGMKVDLVSMQSSLVLNSAYCDGVCSQLAARDAAKKKKAGERLVGDGLPRLLTSKEFMERVETFEAACQAKKVAQDARKATAEEQKQMREEWQEIENVRRAWNEELKEDVKEEVAAWEELRKRVGAKQAGKKPTARDQFLSPIPRPCTQFFPGCIYVLFIAMDACFRLKRRLIRSDLRDPALGSGWLFLLEWEPYREYLKTITNQKEMSSCTQPALVQGFVLVTNLFCPTELGISSGGERYGNMDYILALLLCHAHESLPKMFSYDIACQWSLGLKERQALLPPLVRLWIVMSICQFVVPKMHIKGHLLACQLLFSLLLVPGSGMTNGENIKRLWAAIAGVSAITKLSGHGARSNHLDDHCADQAEHVPTWKAMVEAFEADGTRPNPYAPVEKEGLTEKQVLEAMEREEKEEAEKGVLPLHSVTPSEFLTFALELEDQQRRIHIQLQLKQTKTVGAIRLKPMHKKLKKGLRRLRNLQATYMPSASIHLFHLKIPDDTIPKSIPLVLLSSLLAVMRATDGCKTSLVAIRLQIWSRLLIYKKRQSHHQGANTRSQTLIARNESKIKVFANTYQAAWAALQRLDGEGITWRKLNASEICGLEDPDHLSKCKARKCRDLDRRLWKQAELGESGMDVDDPADKSGSNEDDLDVPDKRAGFGR